MKALDAVPTPLTGGQLMQYVCALNFLRNKISMFNNVLLPLREMLQRLLTRTKRNTKAEASKIMLKDCGWRGAPDKFHDKAFQRSKDALKNAVTLARYDDKKQTLCVYLQMRRKIFSEQF